MAFGDSCYENYEKAGEYMCNIFNEPFKAVLEPFDAIFGGAGELGFTIAIIWGIIIGILWLSTGNIMLCSIVGVVIASSVTGIYPQAQGVGFLLIGLSLGIIIFQLVRHKIQTFA